MRKYHEAVRHTCLTFHFVGGLSDLEAQGGNMCVFLHVSLKLLKREGQ